MRYSQLLWETHSSVSPLSVEKKIPPIPSKCILSLNHCLMSYYYRLWQKVSLYLSYKLALNIEGSKKGLMRIFSRLNNPQSPSLSLQEMLYSPLIIFVHLLWACSDSSVFLVLESQGWRQC